METGKEIVLSFNADLSGVCRGGGCCCLATWRSPSSREHSPLSQQSFFARAMSALRLAVCLCVHRGYQSQGTRILHKSAHLNNHRACTNHFILQVRFESFDGLCLLLRSFLQSMLGILQGRLSIDGTLCLVYHWHFRIQPLRPSYTGSLPIVLLPAPCAKLSSLPWRRPTGR